MPSFFCIAKAVTRDRLVDFPIDKTVQTLSFFFHNSPDNIFFFWKYESKGGSFLTHIIL